MRSDVPQAVLFDMDGTLVDTEGLWWSATASVAGSLGVLLTPDDTPHVLGRTVEDTAAHLLSVRQAPLPEGDTGDASPAPGRRDGVRRRSAPQHGDQPTVARLLTEAFADHIRQGVRVMPGARELLRELTEARIPTALVSASPRSIVDLVMPRLGHAFDLVVAAEDTACGKPYPDPYLKAARQLGVDPKLCVAIEDSPTGVAAATAAGCRVVVVDPAAGLPALRAMSVS
ncbi:HAD family hydrolase [Nonomuraea sediminis]|uniref:HAD family hydrolase n=1 Tax=Nonomuraea sediminis TaxID=2835864 RepID=UPI001BDD9766|nr:HAD family phosphatase [Nonomuraea sediminis]